MHLFACIYIYLHICNTSIYVKYILQINYFSFIFIHIEDTLAVYVQLNAQEMARMQLHYSGVRTPLATGISAFRPQKISTSF